MRTTAKDTLFWPVSVGEMGQNGKLGVGAEVVACWVALQRVGVPTDVWVPRRVWDNGLRLASGVESDQALRYRTKTAKDYRLVEMDPGQRGKQGRAMLISHGAEGQFIPLDEPIAELLPDEQGAAAD